jgi:hypothetical protein
LDTHHLKVKLPMLMTGTKRLGVSDDVSSGLLSGLGEYPKAKANNWELAWLLALFGLEAAVEEAILSAVIDEGFER